MEPLAKRHKTAPLPLQKLVLDALFPTRCCGCTEWSRTAFCPFCQPRLRSLAAPFCHCCGALFDPLSFPAPLCASCRDQPPPFRAARSAFLFEGPIRHAIHRFKYAEKSALSPRLAPYLAELLASDPFLSDFSPHFLVPVPLHGARLRKRGFNQSLLLAHELGRTRGVPVASLLHRTRATAPQVDLDRPARAQNVRGAFALSANWEKAVAASPQHSSHHPSPHPLRGARVLLIDDVFTTGATLGECARTLKKAGAAEVCALTLARQL